MKKKLIFLCILIFIVYILFFPQDAVTAAADGLVLWYERVLPSLLPFAILSNILIYSGFTGYLVKLRKDGTVADTVTMAVNGDVDGSANGTLDISDINTLREVLAGKAILMQPM